MNKNRAPFRARCTKAVSDYLEPNKIYEIDDKGQLLNDDGIPIYGIPHPITSFKDWVKHSNWGGKIEFEEAPALPNICYILGGKSPLEFGEEFEVKGLGENSYWIDESGSIMHGWGSASTDLIYKILNTPVENICRLKFKFSKEEKCLMGLCAKKGFNWLSRNMNGELHCFEDEPTLEDGISFTHNGGSKNLNDIIFKDITYSNSPIDMRKYVEGD